MQITYIGHSGFFVRTQEICYLFAPLVKHNTHTRKTQRNTAAAKKFFPGGEKNA